MRRKRIWMMGVVVAIAVLSGNGSSAMAGEKVGEIGAETVLPAVNPMVVYTSKTGANRDTSGDGSKENPYNRFEDAVSQVADGGTIYIKADKGAFLNSLDEYGNEPFVIPKSVTIEPEPGAECAMLSCRAAGMILGGNVTFRNISLDFANKYHDVIVANGYHLTLENVTHDGGSRLVDLVAGSIYDKDTGMRLGANPGANGCVEVRGRDSWFGNVYGGSLNGSFEGNTQIIMEDISNEDIGEVYACGAAEPVFDRNSWFDFEEIEPPTADPVSYPVSGSVTVSLRNAAIAKVDGSGAGKGTSVTAETDNRQMPVLENIVKLRVKEGVLEPKALTAPVQGVLSLEVPEGATLDLSQIKDMTVADFAGGGKLVLDKDSTLTVLGGLTGETVFEATGGYGEYSGYVQDEHVYIVADSKETGSFTFVPNPAQEDYVLKRQDDGSWKAVNESPYDYPPSVLENIDIIEVGRVVTYSEINGYNGQITPRFAMKMGGVPEDADASYYPFQYTVKYNGEEYEAIPNSEWPSDKYVPDLNLQMEIIGYDVEDGVLSANLYVNIHFSGNGEPEPVAVGDYEITVSYPTETGVATDKLYLTVVEDDAEDGEKSDTQIDVAVDATHKSFGETITVQSTVSQAGGPLSGNSLSGTGFKLYVNGQKIKDSVAYEDLQNGKMEVAVTPENGFVTGDNRISIEFKGNADLKQSIGSAELNVTKCEPNIQTGNVQVCTYDGKAHTLTASAAVPVDGWQIPVTVKYNGEDALPVRPGVYETEITAEETEVSVGKTINGPSVTIGKAKADLILEQTKLQDGTYTVSVVVEGIESAMLPIGTVTLYQNGQMQGSEPLRYGQADFRITPEAGENEIYAVYSGTQQSCYLDETSETVVIIGATKPEEPGEPDNPDEPDEPDKPDNPDEPDEPDKPVKPDEPAPVQATLSEMNRGENGWYTGDVFLHAPAGYLISDRSKGVNGWKSIWTISEDMDGEWHYYLKEDGTGTVTEQKSVAVKRDTMQPMLENIKLLRSKLSDTGAEFTFTSNDNGKFYYALLYSGNEPDKAAIWNGTQKELIKGTNQIILTDLIPSAEYTLYIVAKDKAGNKAENMAQFSFKMKQKKVPMETVFTDVQPTDWFYEEVGYIYENNVMRGVGGYRFDPQGVSTRAMAVQILYNLEGRPAVAGNDYFEDVARERWFADAIEWAADIKVTTGVSPTCFAPDRNVTRQEMACFLYSYAKWKGYDISGQNDLSWYSDRDEIALWAENAMEWANYAGIINGKSSAYLDPRGLATRAEMAAMMGRFMRYYEE